MDDNNEDQKFPEISPELLDGKYGEERPGDIFELIPINSGDFGGISTAFNPLSCSSTDSANSDNNEDQKFPEISPELLDGKYGEERPGDIFEHIPINSGDFEGISTAFIPLSCSSTDSANSDTSCCDENENVNRVHTESQNNDPKLNPSNSSKKLYEDDTIVNPRRFRSNRSLQMPQLESPPETPEVLDKTSCKTMYNLNDHSSTFNYVNSESKASASKHRVSSSRSMHKENRLLPISSESSHFSNLEMNSWMTKKTDEATTCDAQNPALLESVQPPNQNDPPKISDLSVRRKNMKIGPEKNERGKKEQNQIVANDCCKEKDERIRTLRNSVNDVERENKILVVEIEALTKLWNDQKKNARRGSRKK